MDEKQKTEEPADSEKLKQMMAQMQEAEYRGLSPEEIESRKQQKEMRRKQNVEILEDTLKLLEKGSYTTAGKTVNLRYSPGQMKEIQVYLPEEIDSLHIAESGDPGEGPCAFGCENADALALAWEKYRSLKKAGEAEPRILVLNLASATQPGGQTRLCF